MKPKKLDKIVKARDKVQQKLGKLNAAFVALDVILDPIDKSGRPPELTDKAAVRFEKQMKKAADVVGKAASDMAGKAEALADLF